MAKVDIHFTDLWKETVGVLMNEGILLASLDRNGKPNTMTIGWGALGAIWGKPVLIVLVRPSRYTYECIEATGDFTVNVPPRELAEAVSFCGTVSGRDHDKFAERGLTAAPSRYVKSPTIAQCVIHYECRVVHKNDIAPDTLAPAIRAGAYPSGNFHRLYYGEILAACADADAAQRVSGATAR